MRRVCTICKRWIKGLPNKNLKLINGKPLILYSLEQAIQSNMFNNIVVSSDSKEILSVTNNFKDVLRVNRPEYLSNDTSGKLPAIQHCVKNAENETGVNYDTIVDLDVTSPLRSIDDIKKSINMLEKSKSRNLITGCESRRSPYFNLVELNSKGFVKLSKNLNYQLRRQDSPKCFDMNASIYVWKRKGFYNIKRVILGNTVLYKMPFERSLDIDTEFDFKLVEFLMKNKKK